MAVDSKVNQLDPSIQDNVRKMIEDASTLYQCDIHVTQAKRGPEQAQTFHVLDMFLYNSFYKEGHPGKFLPKFLDSDGLTIDWDHFRDPNITWALIDSSKSDFLRTSDGRPASLTADGPGKKKWIVEPDEGASIRAILNFLARHRVMGPAAPGVNRCGEPCVCGRGASKHLTGKAADLRGLHTLAQKIQDAEPDKKKYKTPEDALDVFLLQYHLWRPLANAAGKARELWHVEAKPPTPPAPHPKSGKHGHHDPAHARRCGDHAC